MQVRVHLPTGQDPAKNQGSRQQELPLQVQEPGPSLQRLDASAERREVAPEEQVEPHSVGRVLEPMGCGVKAVWHPIALLCPLHPFGTAEGSPGPHWILWISSNLPSSYHPVML